MEFSNWRTKRQLTVMTPHTSCRFMYSYETMRARRGAEGTRRRPRIRIKSEGYLPSQRNQAQPASSQARAAFSIRTSRFHSLRRRS